MKIILKKYIMTPLLLFFAAMLITISAAENIGDSFFADMGRFSDIGNEEYQESQKKYVALTFDDGPHPVYTNKVLDILEEKNAKATFFVVGFRSELHGDKIRRAAQLGCEIGNHTYGHANLFNMNSREIVSDLEKCNETLHKILGIYPKIYRPPFGSIKKHNESAISLAKILWDVDSLDWKCKSSDKIITNIMSAVRENSIILMHDFYPSTVQALPTVIDLLREKGYELVTVSTLLEKTAEK